MFEKLRRLTLFDWFLILCAVFLLCGTVLKVFFPGSLVKMIRDYPAPRYAEITVALDPRFEWLRENIRPGDNLYDSLEQKVWAQVLETKEVDEGHLKGRTLVGLKVLVMQGDSGLTVFGRYKIRKGERFFFECPAYVFESVIVDWREMS